MTLYEQVPCECNARRDGRYGKKPDCFNTVPRTFKTMKGTPISFKKHRDEFQLFVGGWRVSTYKTERGLEQGIIRWQHKQ